MKSSRVVMRCGFTWVVGLSSPACCGAEKAVQTAHAERARFASTPVTRLDAKVNLLSIWGQVNRFAPDPSICCGPLDGRYPWKLGIRSTVFSIGERSSPGNTRSAWDAHWLAN